MHVISFRQNATKVKSDGSGFGEGVHLFKLGDPTWRCSCVHSGRRESAEGSAESSDDEFINRHERPACSINSAKYIVEAADPRRLDDELLLLKCLTV